MSDIGKADIEGMRDAIRMAYAEYERDWWDATARAAWSYALTRLAEPSEGMDDAGKLRWQANNSPNDVAVFPGDMSAVFKAMIAAKRRELGLEEG